MIIKRLTILIVSFLICSNIAFADRPISWDHISIKVKPAKKSFIVGEPVTMIIRLKNNGDKPVVLHTTDLGVMFDTIQVQITSPKQKKSDYRMWSVIEPAKPSFALKKAQSKSFTQQLHWNAAKDKLAFPAKGTYQVQVTILNLTGAKDIVSNPTNVKIKSSTSKNDKLFQELLSTRHMAGVLVGAAEPKKELVSRLHQLTKQYPRSTFTPYIHYALGSYYNRSFFKRKADPAKATQEFNKAQKLINNKHPLRFELLNISVRKALNTGEVSKATKLFRQAQNIRKDGLELLPLTAAISNRQRSMKKK